VGDAQMGSGSESTTLRAELERVAADHATGSTRERQAMEELAQKSAVIADMSLRIDALSKKFDGKVGNGQAVNIQGSNADLVAHINRLKSRTVRGAAKEQALERCIVDDASCVLGFGVSGGVVLARTSMTQNGSSDPQYYKPPSCVRVT